MAQEMNRRGFFGWLAALLGLAAATAKAVAQPSAQPPPPGSAGGAGSPGQAARLTSVTDPLGQVVTYTYLSGRNGWQSPGDAPVATYVYEAGSWQELYR
jgi:hypothetical protein